MDAKKFGAFIAAMRKAKPIQPIPSIRKIKKRAAAMQPAIFRIDLRSALRCNFTSSKVSVNATAAVSGLDGLCFCLFSRNLFDCECRTCHIWDLAQEK